MTRARFTTRVASHDCGRIIQMKIELWYRCQVFILGAPRHDSILMQKAGCLDCFRGSPNVFSDRLDLLESTLELSILVCPLYCKTITFVLISCEQNCENYEVGLAAS